MTLKLLFKRYIKEIGYYGAFNNFLKEYNLKSFNEHDIISLFYCASIMSQKYNLNWFYANKTIYDFLCDWAKIPMPIKNGDVVTINTFDGKYEFTYKVHEVWLSRMEVETINGSLFKVDRISKINGNKCNFHDGWQFKKDFNNKRRK